MTIARRPAIRVALLGAAALNVLAVAAPLAAQTAPDPSLGVTAQPEIIAKARRALRASVAELPGEFTDMSVVKLGHTYTVSVYYNPKQAVTPEQVDDLNLTMIADVRKVLPGADVLLCISQFPRRWPEGMG